MAGPQWRVTVDASRCIGSGLCAASAPRHFTLQGPYATAVGELMDPDEAISDAAECCPTEAITVEES